MLSAAGSRRQNLRIAVVLSLPGYRFDENGPDRSDRGHCGKTERGAGFARSRECLRPCRRAQATFSMNSPCSVPVLPLFDYRVSIPVFELDCGLRRAFAPL